MGLFNRRGDTAAAGSSTGVAPTHRYTEYHMNRRPPMGQWFRTVWLDLLTMVVLGAVGLGVINPSPSRWVAGAEQKHRFTTHLLRQLALSRSTSRMVKSYTPSLRTLCARTSFQSGSQRSLPASSPSSSWPACRFASAASGTSTTPLWDYSTLSSTPPCSKSF